LAKLRREVSVLPSPANSPAAGPTSSRSTSIPADATVSAVQEIGQKAIALQADLANPDQVAAITADMLRFAGHVDILINNAGVFPWRDIWELDFAESKRIQGINLDSQFLMAKMRV
jgi:NAD(P)-dependent dehydrogenase (short-subunit alcohol dehydrogenase family)